MSKITLFFISLCAITLSGFAQQKGLKSIQVFLQQNADSTLVFEYTSNWMHSPAYLIASKKGDTITLYKYAETFDHRTRMPQKMRDTLNKIHTRKNSLDVGINTYFNSKYLDRKELKKLWSLLSQEHPWQIKDDKIESSGCTTEYSIYDGGGIDLYLITKKEIRKLSFYAPGYYVKYCPTAGRKAILNIEKLFAEAFK